MKERTIMIVGLGALGFPTLELIACDPEMSKEHVRVIATDLDEDRGLRRANTALVKAYQLGFHPKIEFVKMDAEDVDGTAEILKEYEPDLIYSCATRVAWWLRHEVRAALAPTSEDKEALEGSGWGIPFHAVVVYRLMKAVKKAGIAPMVINAAYPDVINYMLSKAGLGPEVGIGNLANVIPRLKYAISRKLKVPIQDIFVYAYGAHPVALSISTTHTTRGAPYYLKILIRGMERTNEVDPNQMMKTQDIGFPKILKGIEMNPIVAASAYRTIRGIWNDTGEIFYAPGPKGLLGGYTIRLNAEGVEVILPDDLKFEEAVKINVEGLKFDGIEKVRDDGTVILTKRMSEAVKNSFNYDLKEFRIEQVEKIADELMERMKELAEKAGVKIRHG